MEIIDKNRQLQEKNSECENLKANSSFEQHLVK